VPSSSPSTLVGAVCTAQCTRSVQVPVRHPGLITCLKRTSTVVPPRESAKPSASDMLATLSIEYRSRCFRLWAR
jgi:hypothetical protein